jgi:hypothetical protein
MLSEKRAGISISGGILGQRKSRETLTVPKPDDAAESADAMIRVLDAWLARVKPANAKVSLVLGNDLVRHALIPWSREISTVDEIDGYANAVLESWVGTAISDWTLRTDSLGFGQPFLVCAVRRSYLDSLFSLAKTRKLLIGGIESGLVRTMASASDTMKKNLLLADCDDAGAILMSKCDGIWGGLTYTRWAGDRGSQFARMIDRELVLRGFGAPPELILSGIAPDQTALARKFAAIQVLGGNRARAGFSLWNPRSSRESL